MNLQYVVYCELDGTYLHFDKSSNTFTLSDLEKADKFDYSKAINIINNSITTKDRDKWKAVVFNPIELPLKNLKDTIAFELEVLGENNWIEVAKDLKIFSQQASKYKNSLMSMLSQTEKEIVDIRHYIEFFDLNVVKGYKAYKILQDRLRIRRTLKDEIFKISQILSIKLNSKDIEHTIKSIEGLDNRKYGPRVLKDLF